MYRAAWWAGERESSVKLFGKKWMLKLQNVVRQQDEKRNDIDHSYLVNADSAHHKMTSSSNVIQFISTKKKRPIILYKVVHFYIAN